MADLVGVRAEAGIPPRIRYSAREQALCPQCAGTERLPTVILISSVP